MSKSDRPLRALTVLYARVPVVMPLSATSGTKDKVKFRSLTTHATALVTASRIDVPQP
jgi:hypothetical protein